MAAETTLGSLLGNPVRVRGGKRWKKERRKAEPEGGSEQESVHRWVTGKLHAAQARGTSVTSRPLRPPQQRGRATSAWRPGLVRQVVERVSQKGEGCSGGGWTG